MIMISGMIFYDFSDMTRIPAHENACITNDMIMISGMNSYDLSDMTMIPTHENVHIPMIPGKFL